MHRKILPTLLAAAALALGAHTADAQVITQWNFNSTANDANTATGVTTPSTGTGLLTLVGGTTNTFASGSPGDPNTTDNSGLQTTGYPAQGTASGTAGVQFAVSTNGFTKSIQISLDFRQSGTASQNFQLQLSTDGNTFVNASGGTAAVANPASPNANTSFSNGGLYINDAGGGTQTFVQGISYTIPVGSPYLNDANFAFRWVAVVDSASGNYLPSNTAGAYASTGNARFDLVTVAVPEPSSHAIIAGTLGLVALGWWARSRRRPV